MVPSVDGRIVRDSKMLCQLSKRTHACDEVGKGGKYNEYFQRRDFGRDNINTNPTPRGGDMHQAVHHSHLWLGLFIKFNPSDVSRGKEGMYHVNHGNPCGCQNPHSAPACRPDQPVPGVAFCFIFLPFRLYHLYSRCFDRQIRRPEIFI